MEWNIDPPGEKPGGGPGPQITKIDKALTWTESMFRRFQIYHYERRDSNNPSSSDDLRGGNVSCGPRGKSVYVHSMS